MALVLYKILTLLALAIFSLLCGLLPYPIISYFKTHGSFRSRRVTSFISAVICFSGGTLLGIAFLHLMPDMRQKLAALPKTGINSNPDIPVSDILTCGGFFFVYLLDELMHILVERCVGRKSVPVTVLSRRSRAAAASTSLQENINSQSSGMMGLFSLDTHVSSHHRKFLDTHPIHYEATHRDAHLHHMVPNGEVELESTDLAKDESAQNDATSAHENDCEAQEEGTPEQHRVYAVLPAVSGLITILALSFHDVFEGLAIGVESRERDVLFMYLSVAVHKYAIAFCIGLDLVLAGTKMAVIFIYILTYSAVTPIGIVIGMFTVMKTADYGSEAETSGLENQPVVVVLQGLAGGTLIYVVCFEVMQREGSATHVRGVFNVLFVLIGFSLTLGFKILFGHKHASSHGHHCQHDNQSDVTERS